MSFNSSQLCINYDVCSIIKGWDLNITNINNSNSPYTILPTDVVIYADATAGPITINLSKSTCKERPSFIIKKTDSTTNAVTIIPHLTSTIQGAGSFPLLRVEETVWLTFDFNNNTWKKISNLVEDIITTKGDLITFNGTTAIRFPVGTDGQILSADSTTASGLKYVNSGGGGEINTGLNVGVGTGKVFQSKVGTVLQFRSLLAGRNIALTNGATDITIDNIPGVELINTSAIMVPTVAYELTQININTTTGGGSTLVSTLADGTIIGQRKIVSVVGKTGADLYQLNITTFLNGTGLLFNDDPDTAEVVWTVNGWALLSTSGATVIGGPIPTANMVSYTIASVMIEANTTSYTTIGYFPFLFARYFNYVNGKLVFNVGYTDRALSVRVYDSTNLVVLGTLTGIATSSPTSFNVATPLTNSTIEIQVKKDSAGGTSPRVLGINLEFDV